MATSTGLSLVLSLAFSVITFATMQLFKSALASTEVLTILGGFIGAILFMLLLTAMGNVEQIMFGRNFQTKLVPEVVVCMVVAAVASGLVHRVCFTTCIIFSCVDLYFMNRISTAKRSNLNAKPVPPPKKKK